MSRLLLYHPSAFGARLGAPEIAGGNVSIQIPVRLNLLRFPPVPTAANESVVTWSPENTSGVVSATCMALVRSPYEFHSVAFCPPFPNCTVTGELRHPYAVAGGSTLVKDHGSISVKPARSAFSSLTICFGPPLPPS